jgi:outer membrane autotransporter protein
MIYSVTNLTNKHLIKKVCMNHIYRIIWNHATSCYQAVTESAKGHGKSRSLAKNKLKIVSIFSAACLSINSFAAPFVLDFEGVGNYAAINNFYNGGTDSAGNSGPNYGVSLSSNSLALTEGNYSFNPSPPTILFFQSGSSTTMNVPAGFQTGFSFYYSSSQNVAIKVWSGLNGTGNLLGTLNLTPQMNLNCTGTTFCNWTTVGITFSGLAKSIDFAGAANQVGFDDVTFGSQIAGVQPTNIDLAVAFYDAANLGASVNPAFEGGTLKISGSNTFAQNFTINNLGGKIDANGKAATFSGVFSDLTPGVPSMLAITDSSTGGVVTLSGVNTYTGATTIAGGTLALAGSGSIATSSGVNISAAGAKFDVSGVTSKATTIQDFSGIAGTTVNTGATVLTVGTANSTTFAGEITGSGGLNKVGSGTLEITGNSAAFTGQNTVNGGHLKVNGYLGGSSLDVSSGSLLSGSGTVGGQTTIRSGGTISPGNSIGTLSVAGGFTQEGGSNYEVQVDPNSTSSDRIAVSGSANLAGGAQLSVSKTSNQNYILETKYTILSASGGVNGKYTLSGDTAVSAFYNLQDQYDANNVYLKVAQTTPFQAAGETRNQIATGAGLQSTPNGSKLHNLVGNMQDFATARGAFDQMSGEIYASMAGARMSDASEVRQATTNRMRSAFCADSVPIATAANAATSADAAAVQTCQSNPEKSVRWAQVLGTRATTNGDGNAASLDNNGAGLVIGADMKVGDASRAGIFFNAKNSTYSVNDRLSSAKQQDVGIGIYSSGKAFESVNMDYRVGGTYTQHDVTASRRVNFKGLDESLKGSFKANTTQIFGEIGSRVALSSDFMIEPFANLAFVRNDQKAFDEQPVAESTAVSALHSVKKSQDMAFATIGVRAAADYMMGNAKLSARGMVGLRNVISKNVPLSTHQFSKSDEFTVAGVPVAKNQLVTEVGVGYDINDQISVGVSYTGQFASGSRNQGLKATLEIKF